MRNILFILALLAVSIHARAAYSADEKFAVDHICYRIVDEDPNDCYCIAIGCEKGYKGNIVIPAEVKPNSENTEGSTLSDSGRTLPVRGIDDNAFSWNLAITGITLPSSLTFIGENALAGTSISKVDIPEGVTRIGKGAFSYCEKLTSVNLPSKLTVIPADMFIQCFDLQEIEIPNTVTEIQSGAFYYSGLKAIDIPASVKTLAGLEFCYQLETVTLHEGLEVIDHAFCGDASLREINIPASVKQITKETFTSCKSMEHIHVEEGNTAYSSYGGSNVIVELDTHNLLIANGEFTIPEGVETITSNTVFCQKMKEIKLPESLTTIQNYAMLECESISQLHLPRNVRELGQNNFMGNSCKTITVDPDNQWYDSREGCNAIIDTQKGVLMVGCAETRIPEGVTEIGPYAFYRQKDLKTIVIPASVTTIGHNAFYGCSNLTDVTNLTEGEPQQIGEDTFGPTYTDGKMYFGIFTKNLHVKNGMRNKFQADNGWNRFQTIYEDAEKFTDVPSIASEATTSSAPLFDLQGRRLQQKPAKGLYIQGGRKVLGK